MDINNTRITVSITQELVQKFTDLTRQIGVSGTALLTRTLGRELDYFAEIPSNGKKALNAFRLISGVEQGRLNFTINRKDAERMDSICLDKNVPRNAFIRTYIDFLVNGDPGVCEGPLSKANAILANPRYEYDEKKQGKVAKDRENPYRFLHLSEAKIAEVIAIMAAVGVE